MKKRAVLFDIDGTLIDTWDFVIGAFKYTLILHNHPEPSEKFIKSLIGRPLLEFYKAAFPNIEDVTQFAKTHHDYQKGKFDLGKPFPKARETLEKLKAERFFIAAISNRTKKSLHKSLKIAKLYKLFDVILSAEDVKNPKPHKEHLMVALNFLKVSPVNAFMVGDTDHDVLAGKNAGVKTIGVTYGFSGKKIKNHNPDFVIDNLEKLLKVVK